MARKRSTLKGGMVSRETTRSFRAASKKIRAAARDLEKVFPHGLYLIGEEIITDVKDAKPGKGVPVRHGTLRGTGRAVLLPGGAGVHAQVELSFGGAGAEYALIQHETLSYNHRIGEARYLVRGIERWHPLRSGAWEAMRQDVDATIRKYGRKPDV